VKISSSFPLRISHQEIGKRVSSHTEKNIYTIVIIIQVVTCLWEFSENMAGFFGWMHEVK